jgi:ABC-type uncharacterized transport system permease subunit
VRMGVLSIVITIAFWTYLHSGIGPNAFTESPYVIHVALPGLLLVGAAAAIVASFQGSKWWLVALAGPLWGLLFLFAARS